jgi:arylformamidase
MKYHDISPMISSRTAVFPGDREFRRNISLDFKTGANLLLSSIETTLHLGAHADSVSHYHSAGGGIEQRKLSAYFGKSQVIEVQVPRGARVYPQHLKGSIEAPRVLFKTSSFPDSEHWNSDFNSLSPELIHFLHEKGVILVGLDTPSVDPETSKALESHQALYQTSMAVLEGLELSKVPEGSYQLVALPLRLKDADASPVRAILIEGSEHFPQSLLRDF